MSCPLANICTVFEYQQNCLICSLTPNIVPTTLVNFLFTHLYWDNKIARKVAK